MPDSILELSDRINEDGVEGRRDEAYREKNFKGRKSQTKQ